MMAADHFDARPKPVPDGPTECRGCNGPLEPLRRWGGLCKTCVRNGTRPRPPAPASQLKVVRHFEARATSTARRAAGRQEHWVEVVCSCGQRLSLTWTRWIRFRPHSCPRCHRQRKGTKTLQFDAKGC